MAPTQPLTFDAIDDATAALIIHIQQEDFEVLRASSKGKGRENESSDSDHAIGAFQEELQQMKTNLSDRCMSRSLARAVISDSALLAQVAAEEQATANDRAVAEQLNGGGPTPSIAIGNTVYKTIDDLAVARLTALCVSGANDKDNPPTPSEVSESEDGESSGWATSRTATSNATDHECVSCGESKRNFEVLQTPCGHHYCQQCLSTLFELSTNDETLFPPRCCRQNISLESARLYLSATLAERFLEKTVEFSTADRTYCSKPVCSSFIPPAMVTVATSTATCILCHTETCTICKGNTHDGDCPEDIATQLTLAAAREQGWQRCYNCRLVVELDIGCNHMTCRCGAEFCYVCGLRWKSCPCPQWAEARLYARAHQLVARDQGRNGIAGARQALQVQQAVNHLRERHNCAHVDWEFVRGQHRCEECRDLLSGFIFECRQCGIQACQRCKRNRLCMNGIFRRVQRIYTYGW